MGAVLEKTTSALTASSSTSVPSTSVAASKPSPPAPAPRPLPLAPSRPSPRATSSSRPMIPPTWRGGTSSNLPPAPVATSPAITASVRSTPAPTTTPSRSEPHETKAGGDNPFAIAEALRHRMDQQYIESVKKAAYDHASRIEQETKDAFADIETRVRASDAAHDASRKRLLEERQRAQERHDKQMAINQMRLVEMLKAVHPRDPSHSRGPTADPSYSRGSTADPSSVEAVRNGNGNGNASPIQTPALTSAPARESEYNHDDNPPAPEFRRAPHLEQWFSKVLKLSPAMIVSNTIDSLCRSAARKNQSPPSWIWKSLSEEKMRRYQLSFDHFKGVQPVSESRPTVETKTAAPSETGASNFEFQPSPPSTSQAEWTPPTNLTPSIAADDGQGLQNSTSEETANVNPFEAKMTTRGAILGVWGTSMETGDHSPILGGFFNRKESTRTARRRKREDEPGPVVVPPPARISVAQSKDGMKSSRGTKQTTQQLPSRLSSLRIAH